LCGQTEQQLVDDTRAALVFQQHGLWQRAQELVLYLYQAMIAVGSNKTHFEVYQNGNKLFGKNNGWKVPKDSINGELINERARTN